MIISSKKLQPGDLMFLKDIVMSNPILIKILTEFLSYQNDESLNNCYSIKMGNDTLAIFLIKGDNIYLHISMYQSTIDIVETLKHFGSTNILVNSEHMLLLPKQSTIFLLSKYTYEKYDHDNDTIHNRNLKDVPTLIQKSLNHINCDLMYVDISHKVRHDYFTVNSIIKNDIIVGSILEYNYNENISLVDGLYVLKEYQKQNVGQTLLKSIYDKNKNIFLLATNENIDFYLKQGFNVNTTYNWYSI